MKTVASLVALLAVTATATAADSAVTFQNNVFTPLRLVTFDSYFGPLAGSGVRNGVDGTASYVAQLFMVAPGGAETPVGAPANFRLAPLTPGTWSGASRTLVGVAPGTPVNLVVKVWDNSHASYEAASADLLAAYGKSAVFSYTQPDPVLLPSDTYMTGFAGFSITRNIPEPRSVALVALGLGGLLWLRRR
jgi:hypothetical protein